MISGGGIVGSDMGGYRVGHKGKGQLFLAV